LRNPKFRILISVTVLLAFTAASSFAATAHSTKAHGKSHHKHTRVKRAGAWKKHGQHGIDADRARDIQEALIREHYLSGTASGVWDNDSKAAMAKFQKDQGWQSKRIPDARALIKLGLGPTHEANPTLQVAGPTANLGADVGSGAPQR
jgi:hypothetical protein